MGSMLKGNIFQECEFGGPDGGPWPMSGTSREIVNSYVWNGRVIGYVY